MEVVMNTKDEKLNIHFEGHTFEVAHDKDTNENLCIRKVL